MVKEQKDLLIKIIMQANTLTVSLKVKGNTYGRTEVITKDNLKMVWGMAKVKNNFYKIILFFWLKELGKEAWAVTLTDLMENLKMIKSNNFFL